jgi:hypothetical protein
MKRAQQKEACILLMYSFAVSLNFHYRITLNNFILILNLISDRARAPGNEDDKLSFLGEVLRPRRHIERAVKFRRIIICVMGIAVGAIVYATGFGAAVGDGCRTRNSKWAAVHRIDFARIILAAAGESTKPVAIGTRIDIDNIVITHPFYKFHSILR